MANWIDLTTGKPGITGRPVWPAITFRKTPFLGPKIQEVNSYSTDFGVISVYLPCFMVDGLEEARFILEQMQNYCLSGDKTFKLPNGKKQVWYRHYAFGFTILMPEYGSDLVELERSKCPQ